MSFDWFFIWIVFNSLTDLYFCRTEVGMDIFLRCTVACCMLAYFHRRSNLLSQIIFPWRSNFNLNRSKICESENDSQVTAIFKGSWRLASNYLFKLARITDFSFFIILCIVRDWSVFTFNNLLLADYPLHAYILWALKQGTFCGTPEYLAPVRLRILFVCVFPSITIKSHFVAGEGDVAA